ncbi:MAG: lysylphosphatidylglycerol synthase domain-containing protein, partial [Polyangiaceae bacterium]|nr:lysylphosphatidylglycerol synthase domain-containing protein [Polyangiaceae bacterium]
ERASVALNSLLPLGNHGGQIIKLTALRHWYRSDQIVTAGVWTMVATGLCNNFTALGVLVAFFLGFGELWVVAFLALTAIILSVPSLFILFNLKRGLVRRATAILTKLPASFVKNRRKKILAWASKIDSNLGEALGSRAPDFRRLLALKILAQTIRILEIWMVIELLHVPGGLLTALVYNAMFRAVTQIVSFVPGKLGVMEIASAATFAALGFTSEMGLSVALALRVRFFANQILCYTMLSQVPRVIEKYPALSN